MNPYQRLILPLAILLSVGITGVLGFSVIEKTSLLDSLYMVIITLSTVGFNEVVEPSATGKIFIIVLIVFGVVSVAYAVSQFFGVIIEGEIIGFRRRRSMERKIKEMKDHYIICGFGRVGHQVAEDLKMDKIPFVVIDQKAETSKELADKNVPFIIGDATSDEALKTAGIEKAKGLLACADSDTENVFVILSARGLNPKLYIIARAAGKESLSKLEKAGADRVISPYFISGRRMASMALKPVAVDFLDTVMRSEHVQLALRELKVSKKSALVGKSLGECQIRQKSGATILAIRKIDETFNLQPLAQSKIGEGDILIAIGTQEQLEILKEMVH